MCSIYMLVKVSYESFVEEDLDKIVDLIFRLLQHGFKQLTD
ncbi:putative orphan protein [Pseudoalteromonas translucida]|uniref:Orphan protein n=1 Tax=Pseudoalteromonas translucida (strain TAC 125) TaxID=326442 RepID=Q3IEG9_PSET1|nr:putative orphan protein [Pseudoalteromonas translucida]